MNYLGVYFQLGRWNVGTFKVPRFLVKVKVTA